MGNKIKSPSSNESRVIKFMILLGIVSIINFVIYFFQPEFRANPLLFTLLAVTILYSVLKKLYMWYNYSNITVPEKPELTSDLKVDVLTTYFPGEPYQMITTTLKAITRITYPHTTYLCDEANDPYLKKFCQEHGICHVTRDTRKDAKAGNINNTLEKHATGDICVILDPDHIPEPDFIDSVIQYFEDPEIGFVQIVQSYYNIKESLVARGAAEQTFQFYGPMMMTLNSYGAVNAIGANCVFRRAALDSIGGHAPGLCEDMHTAMLLYSRGWKAVYVPEVLARGLAPSNLTNFFKQQLKWARGTFDLLVKVYPRIFSKLTTRQKIHFGILPLHYLGGVISLINFLIPVLALFFSITPWKGNIIDFVLVLIPVAASSLLIRTYIQKWVIEKKERGFHIVGGLMHINTWWIYILGLVYTIIDRKVLYLPTPKEEEWDTNLKIVIPNAVVAIVSIFAIVYGLKQDLTPFSLIMAGFAFFNASIMIFGIYLSIKATNRNKILRSHLQKKAIYLLWNLKQGFYKISDFTFNITRHIALPLLLLILITAMSSKRQNDLSRWEQVETSYTEKQSDRYFGIFHPNREDGLPALQEIRSLEREQEIDFDIISFYLAWGDENLQDFPDNIMKSIYQENSLPMITWEPWASELAISDTIPELQQEKKVFKYMAEGYFDDHILKFARLLKSYDQPVFLRFAHEFDNPQYPWSPAGENSPEEFVRAWKHLYELLNREGSHKIVLVWNPWKAQNMADYFPGNQYIDWIGVTLLNYGPLNSDGSFYRFEELYNGFHAQRDSLSRKPVMLAEFGSVKIGDRQKEWVRGAMNSMQDQFREISAVVMFNSALDKNIPANDWYQEKYIDWTIDSLDIVLSSFQRKPVGSLTPAVQQNQDHVTTPITRHQIRGVRYMKGVEWKNSYYALTKEVLEQDFESIKTSGINTIQFKGGNIYDYNILSASENHDLKVIYEFGLDNSAGFINDPDALQEMRERVLEKIHDLKGRENIIGYSFNYDLENYFHKPLLFYQRRAYLEWFSSLVQEIKEIDSRNSVMVNLALDSETGQKIQSIEQHVLVDSYGLLVQDTTGLRDIRNLEEDTGASVFISSLDPRILAENSSSFEEMDVILQNWQDERKSNLLTFDGLIDFKGQEKLVLKEIAGIWSNSPEAVRDIPARILKPARPLIPGHQYTYHAMLYTEHEWILALQDSKHYQFSWSLVKKDSFGNHLALKELGSGPSVDIQIPEQYKHYEVLLTTKDNEGEFIVQNRTSLHTPLRQ